MSNPYVTVQGPNYGAGLMNWQGLLNPSQGGAGKPPQQQQGAAPGQSGQPNQAQQQIQGLGQRLMTMFGGGQPQPGNPMPLQPPTMGAPQPSMSINPASLSGIY
jgi:hypothetical protein